MSICGATDTPVLDFWWCLLWVSKPEWVLPYSNYVEAYVIYVPWDSPLPVKVRSALSFCCRPSMRTGSSVILIALAVFDNLALLLGLPDHLLEFVFDVSIDEWSEFACKTYGYVRAIVDYVAGYLVVVFTIFRVISVYLPHKNNIYCTRRRAYFAVMATVVYNEYYTSWLPH